MNVGSLNNDFLIKSFVEMVNCETKRITDGGLIDCDVLEKYIKAKVDDVIKNSNGYFDIIKCLSETQAELSSIKLPQDATIIKSAVDKLSDEDVEPEEEEEMKQELEEFVDNEDESDTHIAFAVRRTLQKIAHYVGEKGDHHAAYLIERSIDSIK